MRLWRTPNLTDSRVWDWIEQCQREWIGWSFPPPHRAVEDAGWVPDDPSRYCPRCGGSVGPGEVGSDGCGGCRTDATRLDGVVRLGAYVSGLRGGPDDEPPLREWILALKYRRWSEMGRHLGGLLGEALLARFGETPCPGSEAKSQSAKKIQGELETVIVPVPMPRLRRWYRGIDHAMVLSHGVRAVTGWPVLSMLKKRNGPPQVGLTATARRARRVGWIRVRRNWIMPSLGRKDGWVAGWPIRESRVVVIDDVRTTGATLEMTARLLKRLGAAEVVAGVVAVTEDHGRRVVVRKGVDNQAKSGADRAMKADLG